MENDLKEKVFQIKDKEDFNRTALDIFRIQAENNPVFKLYLKNLGDKYIYPHEIADIPFLPAAFFKSHKIMTGNRKEEMIFQSSGTTGRSASLHYITDLTLYEKSFLSAFRLFYGNPDDYIIYALLPSYTETENSSLVYMVSHLIRTSGNNTGGFYKDDHKRLLDDIEKGRKLNKSLLLIGVSYALLDFAESCHPDLSGVIVMETGGMKGRKEEIVRMDLHFRLKEKSGVDQIHSEYGMTELLSQAYSYGNGVFRCPPWMKILIRDPHDPLSVIKEPGKSGGINIIDLANIYSCSFIATDDIGRLHEDGSFEVLGRFDNSDVRGCNLLF